VAVEREPGTAEEPGYFHRPDDMQLVGDVQGLVPG
jgi:hypothetical protein